MISAAQRASSNLQRSMNSVSVSQGEWRRFWTLPISSAFGYSTAVLHSYSLGSFIEPLQRDFGWSRAQISVGITVAGVVAAIFSVPIGLLVDRVGPRRLALTGVLLMTSAFALFGTATGDTTNWFMLWSFLAFANLWLQATVWTKAVASRFEQSRGFAFAVTLSGASVAATVFPLLATWLIRDYGWRTAFMAMGGIWAALVFPILFFFFHSAHEDAQKQGVANVGSRTEEGPAATPAKAVLATGMSVPEGFRSPALYQLVLAAGLFTFTALGIIVHFVPILKDAGTNPLAAAGIASLVGVFSVIGRLGTGLLLDRLSGRVVGASVFLLPIIACALLYFWGTQPVSQSVAAAIFGLTVGAEVDVIAYLASQHFGLKNFGVFSGCMIGALALGAAFGPLAAGAAFDRWGSYRQFLVLTMICMGLSSVFLATLSRPRFAVLRH
jgi:MFS family permease